MTASVAGPIARSAFVLAVCLASSSRATAQQNTAGSSPAAQDPHTPQSTQAAQTARDAQPEYPSLHLSGFADVNFAAQDKSEGPLRTTGIAPIVVTDIEGNPKTSQ